MRWIKKGRIFEPRGQYEWMQKYAILPTPVYLENEGVIRVFFGTAGADNISSITCLDLDCRQPEIIVKEPCRILLTNGEPGLFDDSGVNPCSIVFQENKMMLYYVGYQRFQKVPVALFPGLAIGDAKAGFTKRGKVPIIDRSEPFPFSMGAPFVMKEEGIYRMWLWIGLNWTDVRGKAYLSAQIGYAESTNGIDWKIVKNDCIALNPGKEISIGRPWILKDHGRYRMFYSVRHLDKLYRLGYAESTDGLQWIRRDETIGIDVSDSGWDSEMICYPAVISVAEKTYLFYNGNNNGASGFGLAELMQDSVS